MGSSKSEVPKAIRNNTQIDSDFGPVMGGEKAVVKEEQSKLSEKHSKGIREKSASKYGDLYESC